MEMVSYFYVLLCKDGSFYAGYTTDLERREQEHNAGIGAKYTRPQSRRPVKMIYAEPFVTRSEATKAEYAFKKQKREKKIQYLEQLGVRFPIDANQPCKVKQGEFGEKGNQKNAESKKF